jgi:fructose-bisphosphate aldolase class II
VRFVADTGVDALAVAVGSSHAMTSRTAQIDLALIAAIHARVPVPLVLHGSSGVADQDLVAAVEAGMTKVNIATHLNATFTATLREFLAGDPDVVDPAPVPGRRPNHGDRRGGAVAAAACR